MRGLVGFRTNCKLLAGLQPRSFSHFLAPAAGHQWSPRNTPTRISTDIYASRPALFKWLQFIGKPSGKPVVQDVARLVEGTDAATESSILDSWRGLQVTPRVIVYKVALEFDGYAHPDIRYRLLRMAWNNGETDVTVAGVHLVSDRVQTKEDEYSDKPPRYLLAYEEASVIVDDLLSRKDPFGLLAKAHLLTRLHAITSQSDVELREKLSQDTADCLYDTWKSGHFPANKLAALLIGELSGRGVMWRRDGELAKEWLTRAAGLGSTVAASYLSQIHRGRQPIFFGRELLFTPNKHDAVRYDEIASGKRSHAARYAGLAYYLDPNRRRKNTLEDHVEEWGVQPDDAKAALYFNRGRILGDEPSTIRLCEMIILERAGIPGQDQGLLNIPSGHLLDPGSGADLTQLQAPERVTGRACAEQRRKELMYARDLRDDLRAAEGKWISRSGYNSPLLNLEALIDEFKAECSKRGYDLPFPSEPAQNNAARYSAGSQRLVDSKQRRPSNDATMDFSEQPFSHPSQHAPGDLGLRAGPAKSMPRPPGRPTPSAKEPLMFDFERDMPF